MLSIIKCQLLKGVRCIGTSVLIIALVSCASTTTVQVLDESDSIDRNVKIYLDGSYRGRGEVIHSDTKIVGSMTDVILKKEGCRTQRHSFSRSERLLIGALIGGIFVWIPLLWIMGYNPMHSYNFQCESVN